LSVIIGKRITTKDEVNQFAAVVNEIYLGSTIYAVYSHTTGPKDSPNTAMKKNSPKITSLSLISGCV
jgi:hypothetical protein